MDRMRWNEEEFLRVYKGSATFVTEENRYYRLLLELLKDEVLLSHIRFANDTLSVPPLKSFILYERDVLKKDVFREEMSRNAKRGLGACFGYLYKVIYGGYEAEQGWVNDDETGVKTASFYVKTK